MKEVELPDGSIGEFPDDMDDAAIESVLKNQFAAPSPAEQKPKLVVDGGRVSRLARVGLQGALKGAASIPDLVGNLPNAIWNLPQAGWGMLLAGAGKAADTYPSNAPFSNYVDSFASGARGMMPDVNLQPNYTRQALFDTGIASQEYEPQTPGERIVNAITEGGVSTALSGKPTPAMFGLGATASGVGQTVTEATDNPLLGAGATLLTAIAAPIASRKLSARAAIKKQAAESLKSVNAQRDSVMKAGMDNGLVVSPSEMKNRSFTKTLVSSEAGKIASEGEASLRNSQKIHNIVSKEIGIADDVPITRQVLSDVRSQAHDAGYVPLRDLGEIVPDKSYFDALKKMAQAEESAAKSFPKAATKDARKLAENLSVDKFDSSAAIDQIAELRMAADTAFHSGNKKIGSVYKAAAKALEDAIESHLVKTGQKDLLGNYKNARQQIAKTYTVENVVNPSTGIVEPQELAKILSSSEGGKLTGGIKLAAEFSKAFPKSTKRVDQAAGHGISKLDAKMGGVMGAGLGAAALSGGATIPVAIGTMLGGSVLPAATSALARKRVFSKGFQQSMLPDYNVNSLTLPAYTPRQADYAAIMSGNALSDPRQ